MSSADAHSYGCFRFLLKIFSSLHFISKILYLLIFFREANFNTDVIANLGLSNHYILQSLGTISSFRSRLFRPSILISQTLIVVEIFFLIFFFKRGDHVYIFCTHTYIEIHNTENFYSTVQHRLRIMSVLLSNSKSNQSACCYENDHAGADSTFD